METSNEGRLGLQLLTGYAWKGRSFLEITNTLKKNKLMDLSSNLISPSYFLKALPLKHHRLEKVLWSGPDAYTAKSTYRKTQSIRSNMETPGGTMVITSDVICLDNSNPLYVLLDESKTARPCSSCDVPLTTPTTDTSKYMKTLSQEDNARRRVRSAGMNRPRYNAELNNRAENYSSATQYLHSRNKTFQQNQFNNIRVTDPINKAENVYASNTIQYCGSISSDTQYVPVYYKPNNGKFAVQGAVESSARLARLKVDTITDSGHKMRAAFGPQTANALAYGVPANGYTVKNTYGYPNTQTPVIMPDGTMRKC
jgi:hypothetical protein